ncbi:hypothetical protein BC830DRAFT_1163861 [Chytriomyces sp. MP71]|nr:hypothetical protein BC830DRAFT_1163861 [Chytriomyces sp. MP71]
MLEKWVLCKTGVDCTLGHVCNEHGVCSFGSGASSSTTWLGSKFNAETTSPQMTRSNHLINSTTSIVRLSTTTNNEISTTSDSVIIQPTQSLTLARTRTFTTVTGTPTPADLYLVTLVYIDSACSGPVERMVSNRFEPNCTLSSELNTLLTAGDTNKTCNLVQGRPGAYVTNQCVDPSSLHAKAKSLFLNSPFVEVIYGAAACTNMQNQSIYASLINSCFHETFDWARYSFDRFHFNMSSGDLILTGYNDSHCSTVGIADTNYGPPAQFGTNVNGIASACYQSDEEDWTTFSLYNLPNLDKPIDTAAGVSAGSKRPPVGAIVGGVIGGLLTILLIGVLVLCAIRHKRQKIDEAESSDSTSSFLHPGYSGSSESTRTAATESIQFGSQRSSLFTHAAWRAGHNYGSSGSSTTVDSKLKENEAMRESSRVVAVNGSDSKNPVLWTTFETANWATRQCAASFRTTQLILVHDLNADALLRLNVDDMPGGLKPKSPEEVMELKQVIQKLKSYHEIYASGHAGDANSLPSYH